MYMVHFQCDWVIWHAVSLSIWLLSCLLVPSMWFLWKILHHVGGMMCDNRMTFKTGVVKWTWHCREPQSHYVIITCSQHMEYIHTICPVTTMWRTMAYTITHTHTNLSKQQLLVVSIVPSVVRELFENPLWWSFNVFTNGMLLKNCRCCDLPFKTCKLGKSFWKPYSFSPNHGSETFFALEDEFCPQLGAKLTTF